MEDEKKDKEKEQKVLLFLLSFCSNPCHDITALALLCLLNNNLTTALLIRKSAFAQHGMQTPKTNEQFPLDLILFTHSFLYFTFIHLFLA